MLVDENILDSSYIFYSMLVGTFTTLHIVGYHAKSIKMFIDINMLKWLIKYDILEGAFVMILHN